MVKNIKNNEKLLKIILDYRLFINENHLDLKFKFDELELNSEINSRVKAQNSIEYKIANYMTEKHEYRRSST